MAEGIFISYRRDDSRHAAGRILDALAQDHPRSSLFMDVDNIALGFDFRKELDKRLKHCEIMLVVIGSRWLNARDSEGRRRLDLPEDYVRLEIEMALSRDIRVVPVLLDDTDLPASEDLPESLRELVHRQGTRIQHESFARDLDSLAEGLAPRPATIVPKPRKPAVTEEPAATHTPQRAENGYPGVRMRAKLWLIMTAVFAGSIAALLTFSSPNTDILGIKADTWLIVLIILTTVSLLLYVGARFRSRRT